MTGNSLLASLELKNMQTPITSGCSYKHTNTCWSLGYYSWNYWEGNTECKSSLPLHRFYIEPPKNCSPEQLQKFNTSKEVIKVRTINVIKKWLELQLSDFEDHRLMQLFEGFLKRLTEAGGTEAIWAENLRKTRELALEEKRKPYVFPTETPKPLLPTNLIPRLIRFLDLHPLEVARQMTTTAFKIFRSIRPSEYFHKAWTKNDWDISPNVLALVENFNKV